MTEDVKQVIDWLNEINPCAGCPYMKELGCSACGGSCSNYDMPDKAVELIVRLSAELDAAKSGRININDRMPEDWYGINART